MKINGDVPRKKLLTTTVGFKEQSHAVNGNTTTVITCGMIWTPYD